MDLILFDLDGTLADSAPDLAAAINDCLLARGRPPRPLADLRPWISHGARGLIAQTFGLTPDDDAYEALRVEFVDRYERQLCLHTTLFPGVPQLLDRIESAGMRWGIVTNKVARLTDPLVQLLGLDQRAACVVSGDTAARPKPDPDPIQYALNACGCPPARSLYVGDDRRDIQAGRAAGVGTVAVSYGYSVHIDDIHDWQADHIIDTPLQLLDLLPKRAGQA
jgi:phosphoglycolate phosphatase